MVFLNCIDELGTKSAESPKYLRKQYKSVEMLKCRRPPCHRHYRQLAQSQRWHPRRLQTLAKSPHHRRRRWAPAQQHESVHGGNRWAGHPSRHNPHPYVFEAQKRVPTPVMVTAVTNQQRLRGIQSWACCSARSYGQGNQSGQSTRPFGSQTKEYYVAARWEYPGLDQEYLI